MKNQEKHLLWVLDILRAYGFKESALEKIEGVAEVLCAAGHGQVEPGSIILIASFFS